MIVRLTEEQFQAGLRNGLLRHQHHCERKGRLRMTAAGIAQEQCGSLAEIAAAQVLGGSWNENIGREHYGSIDIAGGPCHGLEVKATEHKTGKLLVYDRNPGDQHMVLAVVDREEKTVSLVGWLRAGDGKEGRWWLSHFKQPCWGVPQSFLKSMESLPCLSRSSSTPPSPS